MDPQTVTPPQGDGTVPQSPTNNATVSEQQNPQVITSVNPVQQITPTQPQVVQPSVPIAPAQQSQFNPPQPIVSMPAVAPTPPIAPPQSSVTETFVTPPVPLQQTSNQIQAPNIPPAKKGKKIAAIIALVVVAALLIGGGLFAISTLYFNESKKAQSISDKFIKAEFSGDYVTYKELAPDDVESEEDYQESYKLLKDVIKTMPVLTSKDVSKSEGKERAVFVYELVLASDNKEETAYVTNFMQKQSGKWRITGQDFGTEKPKLKVSDYSDAQFSLGLSSSGEQGGNNSSENADDRERQSDIKAIHGQVELYYAQNGKYPTLANMNDASFRSTNMKGLDVEALKDPDGSEAKLVSTPKAGVYSYVPLTSSGEACSNTTDCEKYTLTAFISDGSEYTKMNLN